MPVYLSKGCFSQKSCMDIMYKYTHLKIQSKNWPTIKQLFSRWKRYEFYIIILVEQFQGSQTNKWNRGKDRWDNSGKTCGQLIFVNNTYLVWQIKKIVL